MKKLEAVIQGIFLLSLLIFAVGVSSYVDSKKQSSIIKSSVTERDFAQKNALDSGSNNYSFETHFVPGVDIVSDPNAYLKKWREQIPMGN